MLSSVADWKQMTSEDAKMNDWGFVKSKQSMQSNLKTKTEKERVKLYISLYESHKVSSKIRH